MKLSGLKKSQSLLDEVYSSSESLCKNLKIPNTQNKNPFSILVVAISQIRKHVALSLKIGYLNLKHKKISIKKKSTKYGIIS